MVDVDIIEVVKVVVVVGVDFIVIILYGYIQEIKIEFFFGFELLKYMVDNLIVLVICEGGIVFLVMVKKVINLGVYVVVVGIDIMGIDSKVKVYRIYLGYE